MARNILIIAAIVLLLPVLVKVGFYILITILCLSLMAWIAFRYFRHKILRSFNDQLNDQLREQYLHSQRRAEAEAFFGQRSFDGGRGAEEMRGRRQAQEQNNIVIDVEAERK